MIKHDGTESIEDLMIDMIGLPKKKSINHIVRLKGLPYRLVREAINAITPPSHPQKGECGSQCTRWSIHSKWYYIPISAILIFVSFFGATAKEVLAAISKLIVKALI